MENLTAADIAAVTRPNFMGMGYGGYGGFGMGGWEGLIALIVLAGLFGNGGFGGFGGGAGAGWQQGFNTQNILSKLDGITNGLCDGFYAVNTSILNLGQTLLTCCCDIKGAIAENGWQTRDAINMNSNAIQGQLCNGFNGINQNINNVAYKIQDCCCETNRSIDNVRFDMAQLGCGLNNTINNSTRDILESNNANTRAILDFLTQDKISTLTAENQALKFQASQSAQNAFITANQDAQTAELIRRLGADCPIPAYVVPNPNCCYNYAVPTNNCNGCY